MILKSVDWFSSQSTDFSKDEILLAASILQLLGLAFLVGWIANSADWFLSAQKSFSAHLHAERLINCISFQPADLQNQPAENAYFTFLGP